MKEIKVLGTGCPSCQSAEKMMEETINEMGINAKVVKVSDIQKIMEYNIMSTPAIVIDEKVVFKGKTPSKEEAKKILKDGCCESGDTSCCSTSDGNTSCC